MVPDEEPQKPHVLLGKYAPRLNSALRGASYLAKTPRIPDPFAIKTHQKIPKATKLIYRIWP
jgi:hypothetical protein